MISPGEGEMYEEVEEYENEEETSNPAYPDEAEGEDEDEGAYGHRQSNSNGTEPQIGKPQVWIRIRPTPWFDNNVFEIAEDGKTLRIIVEPEDRIFQKKTGKKASFKFGTDGILQSVSQEETFQSVVQEVVEKAMEGVTGAVVFVGPEVSGKSFTLFGPWTKYQYLGVLPRALEKIFEISDAKKDEMNYRVVLSMFEIRKNKIKDLLTLGPYELPRVGENGPKGLFYEEITSIEQALGLILRGIEGQKMLPREAYAKYHTIVYLDIIGISQSEDSSGNEWRSRITFAKIASMPNRDKQKKYPLAKEECPCPEACYEDPRFKLDETVKEEEEEEVKGKCCRGILGKMGEAISIRKDMSFLEQMFVRSHDLRKINEYYAKLESLGMYMLMKPPRLAPSQYFRQSKLAHCLKDIVSGKTEIRILLHVRPERAYLQSTLEAMRFAQRARCVPLDVPKKAKNDNQTFEQKIANMCEQLGISDQLNKGPVELSNLNSQISPDKMREVLAQATTYFEEKLDSLEGSCKDQVKAMFETFREMWTHMLEKDWADGEANKPQEPPPEALQIVETVDASQTTDEHINTEEERDQPHSKRRSSINKKKLPLKDKAEGGIEAKEKKSRGKKKKRKSSVGSKSNTNKHGESNEDSKGSAGSHESQNDMKHSIDRGLEVNWDRGESEGEGEHLDPLPPSHQPQGVKKSLVPEHLKKTNDPGVPSVQPQTVAPPNTAAEPAEKQRKSQRKSKQKSIQESVPSKATAHQEPPPPTIETPAAIQTSQSKHSEPRKSLDKSLDTNNPPPPADKNGNDSPFQHEAWQAFSKSSPIVQEFTEKQSVLKNFILDHNETQKEVSNILAKLSQLQMDLDTMQQERYLKSSDVENAVVPPAEQSLQQQVETFRTNRDELVTRLKELREQLQSQQRLVQESKAECQRAFLSFCSETYGKTGDTKNLPLSTLEDAVATTAQEALGFIALENAGNEEDQIVSSGLSPHERELVIAGHFEDLKRIAKRQAQALLQAYPKRPPWARY